MNCPPTDAFGSIRFQLIARKHLPLWRWLIETALLEIINEGRIDELGHIGATELRAPFHPIAPFRATLNGQCSGSRILSCRLRLCLRHLPELRLCFSVAYE